MLERIQVLICGGTGCLSSSAKEVKKTFEGQLKLLNMEKEVGLVLTGCFGLCEKGTVVIVYPDDTFYTHVTPNDVVQICEQHLLKGRPVERLMEKDPVSKKRIQKMNHLKFYAKQKRVALRNCGNINPLDILEYIAKDGYQALAEILSSITPQQAIDVVTNSGLRGRGGGGFLTGRKMQFAANSKSDQKYIICNADEGDPGAFMDRAILEGDPHSVLEAMAILGYATGSNQGYIYVRAEYPVAVERLKIAIKQATEYKLLGRNLFGSEFNFDIEIKLGAGAFVCGEETALIASIEGQRGMSRLKPPFPAVKGLWGKPTIVNNVETLVNIPVIFLKGAEWFKSIGTEKSSGTKVFALGGKIKNTGLVEVPMGTTLREVIFDIGGGIPKKRAFKAVQTGGPSGGCITVDDLDTPIDFDNLKELGSMMGSGGMIIMDENNCMVDVARFYLEFMEEESCGKCTPCRDGTKQMRIILDKICEGRGSLEDIDELERIGSVVQTTSLCGLGQTAPNPVLSTIKHFRDEYIAHVTDRNCPAGVCTHLTNFVINDGCVGCTICVKNCPVDAIEGSPKQMHSIDPEICIQCGECRNVCPVNAIHNIAVSKEALL